MEFDNPTFLANSKLLHRFIYLFSVARLGAWLRRANQMLSDRSPVREAILSDTLPTLDELLSHRPTGRILERDGIDAEFQLIRRAFVAEGKKVPDTHDFKRVGRASGTHLLKLISPRAPTEQSVLRIVGAGANRHPALTPSLDAKMSPIAKLTFRPWEIVGHSTRSLADHILDPDDLSPTVTKGFAAAFGDDALAALQEALTTPLPAISSLPAAEFPIIFLPRPGGGDVQVTPLAPAEAYVRIEDVRAPYRGENVEGQPRIPRGRWHRQYVADKPQNISSAVGKRRTRLFAKMPPVLSSSSAELHRYAHGGKFPRWRDASVPDAMTAYANLLDAEHSNQDIRAGRDRRADELIVNARDFIDDTLADVQAAHPERNLAAPPAITAVLLHRWWPPGGFDQARRVLTTDHFKGRLQAAGEA